MSGTIVIIRDFSLQDGQSQDVIALIEKSLTSTYFSFQHKRYKQVTIILMGSSILPVVVDIFTKSFEMLSLESSEYKSKVWLRYVQDTLIVWLHGKEKLVILSHLNNRLTYMNSTMKLKSNQRPPFLDVLVSRHPNDRRSLKFMKNQLIHIDNFMPVDIITLSKRCSS